MVTLLANYHWVAARLWSELGCALSWDGAFTRGARHIDRWIALTLPEWASETYDLRVLHALRKR